jgi:hypothetical protein
VGILAIIGSILEILKEFLVWQVALTKIKARKVAYDIDQEQMAKGRELRAKIDAARNASDLAAVSLLLDDAAANALYAANVRSAIPDIRGNDVGISGGISTGTTSGSGPDTSVKPVASAKPGKPMK